MFWKCQPTLVNSKDSYSRDRTESSLVLWSICDRRGPDQLDLRHWLTLPSGLCLSCNVIAAWDALISELYLESKHTFLLAEAAGGQRSGRPQPVGDVTGCSAARPALAQPHWDTGCISDPVLVKGTEL